MTVYLVGAGPGDPGLLTVRGAEVLARADVVVHDRLADAGLLELAPPGAERIDVGKSPGAPVDQDAINALLVDAGPGRRGRWCGCKGGDPFVFGRGGEEALALAAAGVAFEVVPGVTSAVAVPAYAGVPVTHRGLSTSFTVVTGHSRSRRRPGDQLGGAGRGRRDDRRAHGCGPPGRDRRAADGRRPGPGHARSPPSRWGTRPDQATVRTTLAGLGRGTARAAGHHRRSAPSPGWTWPGSSAGPCSAGGSW